MPLHFFRANNPESCEHGTPEEVPKLDQKSNVNTLQNSQPKAHRTTPKTRRSRQTNKKPSNNLTILQSNVNSFMSKIDSIQNILETVSPEVVILSELKQKNSYVIQNFFRSLGYSVLPPKKTGLLIAAKCKFKLVDTTCTTNENILTGRLNVHNTPVRIIAVYGLQETCSADDRGEFFSKN